MHVMEMLITGGGKGDGGGGAFRHRETVGHLVGTKITCVTFSTQH